MSCLSSNQQIQMQSLVPCYTETLSDVSSFIADFIKGIDLWIDIWISIWTFVLLWKIWMTGFYCGTGNLVVQKFSA